MDNLRARLRRIVDDHSQAKVARATGVSDANVSRYLKNVRIPADLLEALVDKLDVNPSWLLTGQGATYRTELDEGSRKLATDMLSLMQSVTALSNLQLGVKGSTADRRRLRDIEEALQALERARLRMRAQIEEFVEQALKGLDSAVYDRDEPRASQLLRVAAQAVRLSGDPSHLRRLLHYEARIENIRGNHDRALEIQSRVTSRRLFDEKIDGNVLREVEHTAMFLANRDRLPEARRMVQAALLLADRSEDAERFAYLRANLGLLDAMAGNMPRALRNIALAAPFLNRSKTATTYPFFITIELASGIRTPAAVLAEHQAYVAEGLAEKVMAYSAIRVLTFCHWDEDPETLREARKLYLPLPHMQIKPFVVDLGAALLAVLEGAGQGDPYREFLESEAVQSLLRSQFLGDRFRAHSALGNLARLCGRTEAAVGHCMETEEIRRTTPAEFHLPLLPMAHHHRNVWLLRDALPNADALAARAARYFQRHRKRGYGFLSGFMAGAGLA